ncbi:aspartyl protease family protein At5g10770-like [Cornus florida]|uniref:aspartyl protease family protein At5g10770-like n=1 Tax=Cornus florida TaxID=4283 RepID=UPI00289A2E79|nr:aspartyl protease family protein At5g10770-like [Cornus florida]
MNALYKMYINQHTISKGVGEMGLVWPLVLFLLLTTSSIAEHQEDEQGLNHMHLNLHHVLGPGSPLASQSPSSVSDVLLRDGSRVKHLNYRLRNKNSATTNSTSHESEHPVGPKLISTPLNPGFSIGVGNYYVKIGLGTPPNFYPMVVDTGSSFSWLQCRPCAVYCHKQVSPLFNPAASNTYKSMSCSTPQCSSLREATLNDPLCTSKKVCVYTASYGDSSYSTGYLSQDSLKLSQSETLPGFVYGCGQDNEGLFGQSAGLIGLARHKLSMLAQLSAKYGYAFSYCLPTGRGSGGSLSIGKASVVTKSAYKFTPMITDIRDPSLYFLRLVAIEVAGRAVGVASASYRVPTIIDSGTVITRLPMSVYKAFTNEFTKVMSPKHKTAPAFSILDACFKGSVKGMLAVPKVRMVFQGGADLVLSPQNLLIDVDKGNTCLAFAGSNDFAIIGNHQQQTFSVAYDISSSRIGFASGGCN